MPNMKGIGVVLAGFWLAHAQMGCSGERLEDRIIDEDGGVNPPPPPGPVQLTIGVPVAGVVTDEDADPTELLLTVLEGGTYAFGQIETSGPTTLDVFDAQGALVSTCEISDFAPGGCIFDLEPGDYRIQPIGGPYIYGMTKMSSYETVLVKMFATSPPPAVVPGERRCEGLAAYGSREFSLSVPESGAYEFIVDPYKVSTNYADRPRVTLFAEGDLGGDPLHSSYATTFSGLNSSRNYDMQIWNEWSTELVYCWELSKTFGEGGIGDPVWLSLGSTHQGEISDSATSHYAFTASATHSGVYVAKALGDDWSKVSFDLYADIDETVALSYHDGLLSNLDAGTTYFIRVTSTGVHGPYSIHLDEHPMEGSENYPVELFVGVPRRNYMEWDLTSYYTFTAPQDGEYDLSLAHVAGDVPATYWVLGYDDQDGLVVSCNWWPCRTQVLAAGTQVRFSFVADATSEYDILLELAP
jgi:hypothetical protein